MIHSDTIKLMRECDRGIKMGISSIDDVIDYAHSDKMKDSLNRCKQEHGKLQCQLENLLNEYGDEGKNPGAIVKGMSWLKTNVKLAMNESDGTIADLMTDGCNMGVKSLSKYLNEYEAAEERVKDITKKLISEEERLAVEMRPYL